MIINCSHSGCSCGCTPYESERFKGDVPDIYVAIAAWAQDFVAHGSNPLKKLDIPEESKIIVLKSIELKAKLNAFKKEKADLLERNKSLEEASILLGAKIPKDKKALINEGTRKIDELEIQLMDIQKQWSDLFNYDNAEMLIGEYDE